ncbi:MAG TPA: MlaD family protein [Chitinophagales bacterium]|nr:MlaD family protein [Chitinophagales bacterium]
MKPIYPLLLLAFSLVSAYFVSCGTGAITDMRPRYTVLFENNPQLSKTEKGIYYKGYQIGDIVKIELAPNGQYVAVTIAIDTKYRDMITEYATFYPQKGALQYDTFAEAGSPLPANEHIVGFSSQTAFLGAKTMYFLADNLEGGAAQLLKLTVKILEAFEK